MDIKILEELQQQLKTELSNPDEFSHAMQTCLKLHSLLHLSEMSGSHTVTFEDELWDGLTEEMFYQMPLKRDATIAWCLWHLSRIEDITTNLLIHKTDQLFMRGDWQTKMGVSVVDTGNIMTDEEIISFSKSVNIEQLKNYRMAVGRNTREIIKALQPCDLKRKPDKASLQRILHEGSVLNEEGSKWLIGFWGGKTVAGLLQVPVTLHHTMHIKEGLRIKEKLLKMESKAKK